MNDLGASPSPQPDLPSRELALRAARGDGRALTEFVRATSRQVWRTCAFLVDRASADDLTQETYLRAVRSLPTYRAESEPVRWLLTIARRACADEIAHRQRARVITAWARAAYRVSTIEPSLDVELADAVARLPPERREAFLLTAIAGFSYTEAASLCACPIGTIRSRVARARAELIAGLDAPTQQRWDQAQ